MEIGSKLIKSPSKRVNIYFIGDIHEGNCNCNKKALKEIVNIVKEDKYGYWIGMGDYIEGITHTGDFRFNPITIDAEYAIRDLKDLPRRQAENVYKELEPIDDKCLALLVGNHEETYIKHNTSDVYKQFHEMFKSKPAKLGYTGFFNLGIQTRSFNKEKRNIVISMCLNHGVGGGGYREGYPVNLVHDVFKYTYGDINVMGHIHTLNESKKSIVTVSSKDKLIKKPRLWGTSGCFLNTYQMGNTNYFESQAGRKGESDIGCLKAEITICGDDWTGKLVKVYAS